MKRLRLVPSLIASVLILDDGSLLLVGSFSPSLALLRPRQARTPSATTTFSRASSFATHRRRNPRSLESSEGSTVTKSENYGAVDSEVGEVYQRVAELDPNWFGTYVVQVLDNRGDDDDKTPPALWVASPVMDPIIETQQQHKQQLSSGPSIDDLMMELARLDEDFRTARRREVRIGQRQGAAAAAATAVSADTATTASTEPDMLQTPPSKAQELELAAAATPTLAAAVESDSSVNAGVDIDQEPPPDADEAIEPEADVKPSVLEPTVLAGSSREEGANFPSSQEAEPDVSSVFRNDPSRVGAAAVASAEIPEAAAAVSAAAASADDRVVVYRDSSRRGNEYLTVPFSNFKELGYREADVASLRPEALDLIVKERLPRPRSGVPDRWKRDAGATPSANAELVSIVAESDVEAFVEGTRQRPTTTSDAPTMLDIDSTTPGRKSRVSDEKNSTREETMSRRRDIRDAPARDMRVDGPAGRKAPDRRSRGEGPSRPIYSGRPVRRERTAVVLRDPPKPSAFWPDIDTFRNLLRDEASLRLRILGNDWAGVVKDESDWRLNMYTKWLWTLHHGVGEPIVESRSDRMRRMSSRSAAAAPPAPRARKPLSKTRGSSGRERKRPNPETT